MIVAEDLEDGVAGKAIIKGGYAEVQRHYGLLSGHWAYSHEVGHILGARHNFGDSDGPDNHGKIYDDICQRSIMAYGSYCPSSCNGCPAIPRFTGKCRPNSYIIQIFGMGCSN